MPLSTARSMFSFGIDCAFALSIAVRNRGLPSGSPPPNLAATVISRISLVNRAPRFLSVAALYCLICFHLEWPAMAKDTDGRWRTTDGSWDDGRQTAA